MLQFCFNAPIINMYQITLDVVSALTDEAVCLGLPVVNLFYLAKCQKLHNY